MTESVAPVYFRFTGKALYPEMHIDSRCVSGPIYIDRVDVLARINELEKTVADYDAHILEQLHDE